MKMSQKQNEKRPTHLDLFSGIGGFTIAFEAEGFETIGFSEIDPYCCAVLKNHWPKVVNYGDIRNVPCVQCEVATASHPCQPFSVAGFGAGESDVRYLRPAMLHALQKSGATWFVYENVPGITKVELDSLLDDLASLGYEGQPFNVPACAVGHRQLRMRIWIVAYYTGHPVKQQKMVFPAWAISKPRTSSIRLSENIWKPNRKTYLSEMVGEVHGLPGWTHRAKAIGNAIVPQIAQEIACCIMATLQITQ